MGDQGAVRHTDPFALPAPVEGRADGVVKPMRSNIFGVGPFSL